MFHQKHMRVHKCSEFLNFATWSCMHHKHNLECGQFDSYRCTWISFFKSALWPLQPTIFTVNIKNAHKHDHGLNAEPSGLECGMSSASHQLRLSNTNIIIFSMIQVGEELRLSKLGMSLVCYKLQEHLPCYAIHTWKVRLKRTDTANSTAHTFHPMVIYFSIYCNYETKQWVECMTCPHLQLPLKAYAWPCFTHSE